ncbi:MAG: hypothetical protein ACI9KN_000775 [Gammaproteobacteria bacterium]|jgi:hypothetical protein
MQELLPRHLSFNFTLALLRYYEKSRWQCVAYKPYRHRNRKGLNS